VRKHCPTCTCEPKTGVRLTVYPPNEILYGRCETCGQVRWSTEAYSNRYHSQTTAMHCACCSHPHDLEPGGHDFTDREWRGRVPGETTP
jgi:hypothetical protein